MIQDGTQPISMDVKYYKPVVVRQHLGGTPKNYVDDNPTPVAEFHPCANNACGPLPVELYRKLPLLNADGTPQLVEASKKLVDSPRDPLTSFVAWGGLAAAIGGTVGLLGGAMLGHVWLGAVGGALISGAVAGGIGSFQARGDRIKLDWDVHPIVTERYTGYRESVKPATGGGYQHSFEAVLEPIQVGEYKIPKITHYKEST